ncbi:MurR/RpiR family transcriptional regulator [Carnobacterium gallinarum]
MLKIDNFENLSEVELAIYRFILNNDDKISLMRVRDVANGSHTSATSVMRFIKKIGFDSFPEFKLHLKNTALEQASSENGLDSYFDILNKKNFKKDLDDQVERCADLVMNAGTTVFMGLGASGAIGDYASRKMANLGLNSFASTDRSYPIQSRLSKDKVNVIFVLSVSGNTVEMLDVVNSFASDSNTKIVVITSNAQSRVAQKADYLLDYISNDERTHIYHDLSSQIPCVFILELIIKRIRQKQTL